MLKISLSVMRTCLQQVYSFKPLFRLLTDIQICIQNNSPIIPGSVTKWEVNSQEVIYMNSHRRHFSRFCRWKSSRNLVKSAWFDAENHRVESDRAWCPSSGQWWCCTCLKNNSSQRKKACTNPEPSDRNHYRNCNGFWL